MALEPLNYRVPVANPDGTPTTYLQRLWKALSDAAASGGGGGGGSGTVTSVGGTGTVNGITLTGTVTTSGNLTLGGTLSGVSLAAQTTGTLAVGRGGTGAVDAPTARTNLGAAASGSVGSTGITVSTARLLGRSTAGTGAIEEIVLGTGLSFSGTTLNATASTIGGAATITINGPAGGSFEWTETVAVASLTVGARIHLQLAPEDDAQENGPELLDVVSLAGSCTTSNNLTVLATFSTPARGPINLIYGVL